MAVIDLTYAIKSLVADREVEAREDSPPITLGDFECTVSGKELRAVPTREFATIDEARAALEPYFADWEVEYDMRGLPIRLEFAVGHVENPSTGGQTSQHEIVASATVGVSVSMHIKAAVLFNGPTGEYRSNGIVDFLRQRWLSAAKTVNELPTSAAYALLSFLERLYGDRAGVARKLQVHPDVLSTAGRLSAQSDPLQGRKLKGAPQPLTPEEIGWLNIFIEVVGKRAAYVESGNTPISQISMSDL